MSEEDSNDHTRSVKASLTCLTMEDMGAAMLQNEVIPSYRNGKVAQTECLDFICLLSEERALRAWFSGKDLAAFKQQAFVLAQAHIIKERNDHAECSWRWVENHTFSLKAVFWALASGNTQVLAWWQNHTPPTPPLNDPIIKKRIRTFPSVQATIDVTALIRQQLALGLNGRWDALRTSTQQYFSANGYAAAGYRPVLDFFENFLAALASRDSSKMQTILQQMCSPEQRDIGYGYEPNGQARGFLMLYACTLAMLAWHHGLEVHPDTPWIPSEWLPRTSNQTYTLPDWPFLQDGIVLF
ncbi:hypothetical protein D8I35_15095 [Corticibacter populi]|uniref:Uncharacterized protein n=1 Tax=Corticibacter populi TaxID=1550736 RepID=A0A3M6QM36_9BURK|nr:Imm49 family immunity protein [Corticibacter populi]RMX04140.1 hypothetical protein D8I35_15095 [Corticibacter populi]RZS33153.1 immunity protein 49 of polymorphic toxin system [Corticibacter populi]